MGDSAGGLRGWLGTRWRRDRGREHGRGWGIFGEEHHLRQGGRVSSISVQEYQRLRWDSGVDLELRLRWDSGVDLELQWRRDSVVLEELQWRRNSVVEGC